MFYIIKVNDVVRIPPVNFKDNLKDTLKELIIEEKVGYLDMTYGSVIGVVSIDKVGEAEVKLGDGAAYVDTDYSLLVFKPELQNIYICSVKDVAEFGAFVGLGPFDGLIHVSQIMDDFISYEPKNMNFVGKESGLMLNKEDVVIARLVSLSLKGNVTQSKISMTMRQKGLGKDSWIERNLNEVKGESDGKETKDM